MDEELVNLCVKVQSILLVSGKKNISNGFEMASLLEIMTRIVPHLG